MVYAARQQASRQNDLLRRAGLALACLLGASLLLLVQRGLQPLRASPTCLQSGKAAVSDAPPSSGSSRGGGGSGGGGDADPAAPASQQQQQQQQLQQQAECELDVAGSPWAASCRLLRDACVDQGSIVLHGAEHRMGAGRPGLAPYSIEPELDQKKYIFIHKGTVSCPSAVSMMQAFDARETVAPAWPAPALRAAQQRRCRAAERWRPSRAPQPAPTQAARDYRYANPPIRVRPASAAEGAAYLADPAFSSCTVPVVW